MTDMVLVVGTMLAMRGFWNGIHVSEPQWGREGWLLFVGLAIGLLAKGPVALVLAGLPIVLWTAITGNVGSAWRALPWLRGSLLMLALSVPWYLLAERHTPGFLNYFLIGEHWRRFTEPGWAGDRYGSAHAMPRGTIWLYALAACLPWTVVLMIAAIGRRKALSSPAPIDERAWRPYLLLWGLVPASSLPSPATSSGLTHCPAFRRWRCWPRLGWGAIRGGAEPSLWSPLGSR